MRERLPKSEELDGDLLISFPNQLCLHVSGPRDLTWKTFTAAKVSEFESSLPAIID